MFRDDHEAALERIEALEQDLSREHAEKEAAEQELDQTKAMLERAQAETKALVLTQPKSLVKTGVAHAAMVAQVEKVEKRGTLVALGMGLGTIGMIVLISAILASVHPTGIVAALTMVLIFIPMIVGIGFMRGARCPACGKSIGGDRGGAQLLLLKNNKQCPHCQTKFED